MIAHAIAASAGIASTPRGTRSSSPHSHPDSGISNGAPSAVSVTGRMPVRRDKAGRASERQHRAQQLDARPGGQGRSG